MPLFNYKAKKGPGEILEDIIEADSQEEAVAKLTQQGYYPIRVKLVGEIKEAGIARGRPFVTRIKVRDLNTFTRQLASLIKAGVPILKALNIIIQQTENKYLNNVVSDIARQIKEGQMLSEAMAKYSRIFPPLYVAMIRSGEDSGTLQQVLNHIADHRENTEAIKSRIRAALAYPILMTAVGIATIIVLVTFVIPQLKQLFETFEELPLPTQILVGVSEFMINYWYLVVGAVVLVIIIGRSVTVIEKTAFDEVKLRLPLWGKFIRRSQMARFCRTVSLLLTNGIPILSAIEITIPTLSNEVFKKELKKIAEDLKFGSAFAGGLRESRQFTPFMVNMVAVGEESGHLDETLAEIATTYEREVDEIIKISLSLFEPVLILVMGVVVGFVVMSMLLPIFQIDVLAR